MIVTHQPDASRPSEVAADSRPYRDASGRQKHGRWIKLTATLPRVFLIPMALLVGAATSVAQTGTTSIPNAPTPTLPGAQNPFAGSVASEPVPGVLHISLQDAIDR